jgi:hypothetical protein
LRRQRVNPQETPLTIRHDEVREVTVAKLAREEEEKKKESEGASGDVSVSAVLMKCSASLRDRKATSWPAAARGGTATGSRGATWATAQLQSTLLLQLRLVNLVYTFGENLFGN